MLVFYDTPLSLQWVSGLLRGPPTVSIKVFFSSIFEFFCLSVPMICLQTNFGDLYSSLDLVIFKIVLATMAVRKCIL